MDEQILPRIIAAHNALPEDCRSRPASESELQSFEKEFGPIPPDYRWYLLHCGGGVIGAERIDDINELVRSHRKFADEPWTMKHVFIIGWDGSGNPYGIEPHSGRVLVEDHTFGGVHEVAPSLLEFIVRGLLK